LNTVVSTLRGLGRTYASILDDVRAHGVQFVLATAAAIGRVGNNLADLVAYVATAVVDTVREVIAGVLDIGRTLGDIVLNLAREGLAASLLGAALAQGLPVLERILQGVLRHAGPIGAALDWVITEAGNVAATAWRTTLETLQATGRAVGEVLDWAKAKSEAILKQVVAATAAAGAAIGQFIDWARHAGDAALTIVGEGLTRAGQTVDAILLWSRRPLSRACARISAGCLPAAPRSPN